MKIIICVGNVEIQVEHEIKQYAELGMLVTSVANEFIKVLNNKIVIDYEESKKGGIIKNRKDAII